MRVHLYQGKNLPALDSNGLSDPFVKIDFLGEKEKSEIAKKTLYPEYYKTFVFNDMKIPEAEDFLYCPPVNFHVYDHDWDNPFSCDYMGMCSFYLSNGFKTDDPDAPL